LGYSFSIERGFYESIKISQAVGCPRKARPRPGGLQRPVG